MLAKAIKTAPIAAELAGINTITVITVLSIDNMRATINFSSVSFDLFDIVGIGFLKFD